MSGLCVGSRRLCYGDVARANMADGRRLEEEDVGAKLVRELTTHLKRLEILGLCITLQIDFVQYPTS